jgi:hypothetical protein
MPQHIEPLSGSEADDVTAKRQWVRDHFEPEARHKYEVLDEKLRLLDTILKNNWVEPSETLKLQCLGITFGDALAQELGLKWVTVEDEYGRDPALVVEGTSIITFPLTAISKRVESGDVVDVHELFRAACETILRLKNEGR